MKKTFKTNGRLLSQIFLSYNTTFDALCELINNSIQANAQEIKIEIDLVSKDDSSPYPCTEYRIIDNGDGVSSSDFEQKILEIATDVKLDGKGIGRFAAFQIGANVSIETTAYDNILKKYTNTTLTLNASSLSIKDLSDYKVDIITTELDKKKVATFYKVVIKHFWNEIDTNNNPKKKLISKLFPGKLEEALFLKYSTLLITDKIKFMVNGTIIKKDNFLVDTPENNSFDFEFSDGSTSNIALEYIHYKGKNKNIILSYRIDNNGIKLSGSEDLIALEYPDDNAWLVHIDSDKFTSKSDIFRNLPLDGMDEDLAKLKNEVRGVVREFIKEKHKEYFAFKQTLIKDNYYPYKDTPPSRAKEIAFNQLAFFIEKDYSILQRKETIRQVIYPLLDKAISNGDNEDLQDILKKITALDDEQVKKFKELLDNVALSEIIRFSNDVYKKQQFLDFLHQIIYGEIAEHIKERTQLQKIIEKNLWVFGVEYSSNTFAIFSDKSMKNSLDKLKEKYFRYEPKPDDDNFIAYASKEILDINDFIIYNDIPKATGKHEILIVELKAPKVKISLKELEQAKRYRRDIEQLGEFSKLNISYKIILVSSEITQSAKLETGTIDKNLPTLFSRSKEYDIDVHAITWSDIIDNNRQQLMFLTNYLETKEVNIKEIFERDYRELDTSNLTITTKKAKK